MYYTVHQRLRNVIRRQNWNGVEILQKCRASNISKGHLEMCAPDGKKADGGNVKGTILDFALAGESVSYVHNDKDMVSWHVGLGPLPTLCNRFHAQTFHVTLQCFSWNTWRIIYIPCWFRGLSQDLLLLTSAMSASETLIEVSRVPALLGWTLVLLPEKGRALSGTVPKRVRKCAEQTRTKVSRAACAWTYGPVDKK